MLKNMGKKALEMVSGVAIACAVLASCAFGLARLSVLLFPGWDLERLPWAEWLTVIVIPEAIFIITAVALWQKRRSVAAGILLSAITLISHFVVHITTHG